MNRHDTTNLTRRAFVISTAAFSTVPLLAACARKDDALQKLWTQWQADWRTMETIATQRGWDVTPLKIAPPATDAAVDAVERHHGLKVPLQLRRVLTELSAHVAFGWRIPSHERPMERIEHLYPTDGGIRDFVWKLDHMDRSTVGHHRSRLKRPQKAFQALAAAHRRRQRKPPLLPVLLCRGPWSVQHW